MRGKSASQEDRAAELTPMPQSRAPWRVRKVEAQDDYVLKVYFADGVTGSVDLSLLIASPQAGVFAALKDERMFRSVFVEGGVVTWTNGLDLAPDAMHRAIRASGTFVPGTDLTA